MNFSIQQKISAAKLRLSENGSVLVAFSGGVDSALVVALAQDALGGGAAAVTVDSSLIPREEVAMAQAFTRERGVRHWLVPGRELEIPEFSANPPNRCAACKTHHMELVFALAREQGFAAAAHGVNQDDAQDFRPGLSAAARTPILAPLADAGFTKEDVREAARLLGLPMADKPSMACLATRIPYGEPVTLDKLAMIEQAESYLRRKGFGQCRVRHHGETARVEVEEPDMNAFMNPALRRGVDQELKNLGFVHVSLDLAGYRTGNMNQGAAFNQRARNTAPRPGRG